jgi:coenzyme F420-reducing hydrogenase beta subunit
MAIQIDKNKCCGCMGCMNACPKGAISAVKDSDGFFYPHVDQEECIDCHLCERVCGFIKEDRDQSNPIKAYSLIHKNREVLSNSTSGGAFTALSDMVLKQGGVIFGACMNEQFDVAHIEAEDPGTRDGMRGSIYVQSYTGDTYSKVKNYLEQGRHVLFVGTPCQVGGLMSFLQNPYENLIGVEFLCHGVPNNDFFKAHIRYLEEKYSGKAKGYTFRSKKYAWWTHGIEEITFEDGRQKAAKAVQAYNAFFHSNVSLRPSCLNCTYRRIERSADITIADFWGIERITGKKNTTGVSMLFGNTEKGLAFIESLDRNEAEISEVPFEKVKYRIATKPAKPSKSPDDFWKLYHESGYKALVGKYTDTSLLGGVRFGLKRLFAKYF